MKEQIIELLEFCTQIDNDKAIIGFNYYNKDDTCSITLFQKQGDNFKTYRTYHSRSDGYWFVWGDVNEDCMEFEQVLAGLHCIKEGLQ